jgi:hypothetical protein
MGGAAAFRALRRTTATIYFEVTVEGETQNNLSCLFCSKGKIILYLVFDRCVLIGKLIK